MLWSWSLQGVFPSFQTWQFLVFLGTARAGVCVLFGYYTFQLNKDTGTTLAPLSNPIYIHPTSQVNKCKQNKNSKDIAPIPGCVKSILHLLVLSLHSQRCCVRFPSLQRQLLQIPGISVVARDRGCPGYMAQGLSWKGSLWPGDAVCRPQVWGTCVTLPSTYQHRNSYTLEKISKNFA